MLISAHFERTCPASIVAMHDSLMQFMLCSGSRLPLKTWRELHGFQVSLPRPQEGLWRELHQGTHALVQVEVTTWDASLTDSLRDLTQSSPTGAMHTAALISETCNQHNSTCKHKTSSIWWWLLGMGHATVISASLYTCNGFCRWQSRKASARSRRKENGKGRRQSSQQTLERHKGRKRPPSVSLITSECRCVHTIWSKSLKIARSPMRQRTYASGMALRAFSLPCKA